MDVWRVVSLDRLYHSCDWCGDQFFRFPVIFPCFPPESPEYRDDEAYADIMWFVPALRGLYRIL
jgi:hypothetical protein